MLWLVVFPLARSTIRTKNSLMLNLIHAKTFLAVLSERGFRAAARDLKLSPSTVVEHIKQLEEDLAAPLLVRRRGIIEPTYHGAAFAPLQPRQTVSLENTLSPLRIRTLKRRERRPPVIASQCLGRSKTAFFSVPSTSTL